MAQSDSRLQRLFLRAVLSPGARAELDRAQAHYLINVLRMTDGDAILVFNGRDGEWLASIAEAKKREAILAVEERTREQEGGPDIDYCFAPLKHARLDYAAQKAVEMGAIVCAADPRLCQAIGTPDLAPRRVALRIEREQIVLLAGEGPYAGGKPRGAYDPARLTNQQQPIVEAGVNAALIPPSRRARVESGELKIPLAAAKRHSQADGKGSRGENGRAARPCGGQL